MRSFEDQILGRLGPLSPEQERDLETYYEGLAEMHKLSNQFAAYVESVPSIDSAPDFDELGAFAFRHRDVFLSALRASESAGEALPLNVLCGIFSVAETEAGPRDPFAGDPMKWPNVAGIAAVRDAITAAAPMATVIAECYQAVGMIGESFRLENNEDFIRLLDMLAYGKTEDGKPLLPFPLLPNVAVELMREAAATCAEAQSSSTGYHNVKREKLCAEIAAAIRALPLPPASPDVLPSPDVPGG